MEQLTDFEARYQQLQNELVEVEEMRLKTIQNNNPYYQGRISYRLSRGLPIAGVVLFFIAYLLVEDAEWDSLLTFAGFLCLFLSIFAFIAFAKYLDKPKDTTYIDFFKTKLVAKFVQLLSPELQFTPFQYINKQLFIDTELYPVVDTYKGSDFFYGTIEGVPVQFSEIQAHNEEFVRDTVNKVQRSIPGMEKIRFKGFFFVFTTKKAFKGLTRIFSNSNFRQIHDSDYRVNVNPKTIVRFTDSQAFAQTYAVYSTHPDYLNDFLTMDTQVKLASLNGMGQYAQFAFFDNYLVMSIATNQNYLELNENVSAYKIENLRKLHQELNDLLAMTKPIIDVLKTTNYID